ncbi:hypothetical protein 1 [Hubei tombus-like virus 15]|uniref:hypothetical protein 1 n=1 Tax=Hubei tombus-like virus 15 TaxID=1923261 RepID=UPI00090CAB5A|nr:hypothetical protein 1 [Hubei tombus-like virus 15]APG76573.1 hypothetical protein 1 [Hubei tombus-like virus 15]
MNKSSTGVSTSSLGHGKGPGQGSHRVREAGANRNKRCSLGVKSGGKTTNTTGHPPAAGWIHPQPAANAAAKAAATDPNKIRVKERTTGNGAKQGSQQSLLSKHRWSKEDLRAAAARTLRARVKQLEGELEALRKQFKQSSTGKSGGSTPKRNVDKPGSKVGGKQSNQVPKSSPPNKKKGDRRTSGRPEDRAPPAPQEQSRGDRTRKRHTAPAPPVPPGPSSAMPAKVSRGTGTAPPAAEVTPDPAKDKKRDLPQYSGPSYAATVKSGLCTESNKPIFSKECAIIDNSIIARSAKRSMRKLDHQWADKELTHFLLMEFAFTPRTTEVLRLMHGRLQKHLRTFDTSAYTQEEMYKLSVRTVEAAIRVPQAEQAVRAGLKNDSALEEVRKNNKFLESGLVGNVRGLLGNKKLKEMPGKSR